MSSDQEQGELEQRLQVEKLRADIAKANADREKAELEVREIRRWWRRPAVLQPIATVIISVLATYAAYRTGFFSTKLESLQNKEHDIKEQIKELQSTKSDLNQKIQSLTADRDHQKDLFLQASTEADRLASRLRSLLSATKPNAVQHIDYRDLLQALDDVRTPAASARESVSGE
jgi:DNA repair exonuclease SbcCD ATPase subunit